MAGDWDRTMAIKELRAMEYEFWKTYGEDLLDGRLSTESYRKELFQLMIDSYKVGLLSAAHLIERRTMGE